MATTFEEDFAALAGANETPPVPATEEPQPAAQDAELPETAEEPAAEPVAEKPAEPPAEESRPPRLDDLLAFVPADKADAFKPLIEQAGKDLQRLRSDDGRVAAMQRLYHEAKANAAAVETRMRELEERSKQVTTTAESKQLAEDIKDEQDSFAKEFPEFSEAVNVRFEKLLKKHLPAPPPAAPVQEPTQQAQHDTEVDALASQYAALSAAHGDWQQVIVSPVYQSWKAAQSAETQRLINSSDAQDAIRVLDRFKLDVAAMRRKQDLDKGEARKRLEQNVGVKGQPSRPTAVPDDFESAFNFYANKRS